MKPKRAIDYPSFFDALGGAGYSGWVVVEQDRLGEMPPEVPGPLEGARSSREFIRQLLGI